MREDEDGAAGCGGAALAGDGGDDEGWLPWPPPWELVRWSRHLKDPAWVGGAQTHLGDAAAPVGVVLLL